MAISDHLSSFRVVLNVTDAHITEISTDVHITSPISCRDKYWRTYYVTNLMVKIRWAVKSKEVIDLSSIKSTNFSLLMTLNSGLLMIIDSGDELIIIDSGLLVTIDFNLLMKIDCSLLMTTYSVLLTTIYSNLLITITFQSINDNRFWSTDVNRFIYTDNKVSRDQSVEIPLCYNKACR